MKAKQYQARISTVEDKSEIVLETEDGAYLSLKVNKQTTFLTKRQALELIRALELWMMETWK